MKLKRIEHLSCPFCGTTKPLRSLKSKLFKSFDVRWKILLCASSIPESREGAGKVSP
ncbi:MAG: hypothetical protein QMC89_03045 [Candidatus Hodarchaeaceae archaeon]|nr:hypothetical protein [Candidatus Hodarchaeaceae archaeon]